MDWPQVIVSENESLKEQVATLRHSNRVEHDRAEKLAALARSLQAKLDSFHQPAPIQEVEPPSQSLVGLQNDLQSLYSQVQELQQRSLRIAQERDRYREVVRAAKAWLHARPAERVARLQPFVRLLESL